MQKKIFISFIFIILVSMACFAQSEKKNRYLNVSDTTVMVWETKENLKTDGLSVLSINTKEEQDYVIGLLNKHLKSFYYRGEMGMAFADIDLYKKTRDTRCIKQIFTWDELLDYIRGKKK